VKALIGALALALVGLLGARFGFREEAAPLPLRLVVSTGLQFLVLGFLLGPHGTGLLGPDLLESFSPAVVLGLGWIGLTFGMQFEPGVMARIDRAELGAGLAQALAAFVLLAAVGLAVAALAHWGPEARLLVLAGAAVASISTPTGLAIVFGAAPAAGSLSRLLSVAASLDGAVGLAALATVLAAFHGRPAAGGSLLDALRWLAASVLLGIFAGWLLVSVTRRRPGRQELVLFLLGLALLAAGSQAFLGLSALFGSAVAGAFVARTSAASRRIQDALGRWEQPVHVVFLLLSGALLRWPGWEVVPLVAAYVLLRAGAKVLGGLAALPALPRGRRHRGLGLGLLAQGGLSIAMAVSIRHVLAPAGGTGLDLFFATVVLGVAVSEVVGPPVIRRMLAVRGELSGEPARG